MTRQQTFGAVGLLAIVVLVAGSRPAEALLLERWRLDDNAVDSTLASAVPGGTDATFLDGGGNVNTAAHFSTDSPGGTLTGSLSFDTGRRGDTPVTHRVPVGTGARTFSVWIKAGTGFDRVLQYGDTSSTGTLFMLQEQNAGELSARINGREDWSLSTAAGGGPLAQPYTANQWNHFAVVVPQNATTDDGKFYVNGEEAQRVNSTGVAYDTVSTPFHIGWGNQGGGSGSLGGLMADLQVYDEALSAGDVQSLFNSPGSIVGPLATLVDTTLTPTVITTAARNGDSPDTDPFGTALSVRERNGDPNNSPESQYRAFMKFDLSGLPDGYVTNALLVLNRDEPYNTVNNPAVFAGQVLADWDTSGNEPGYAQATDELSTSMGTALQSSDVFSADVTDFVRAWVDGSADNYGFRIRLANSFQGISFLDSGPDGPQLFITQAIVEAVPEPSTGCLALVGLAAVLLLRRRR